MFRRFVTFVEADPMGQCETLRIDPPLIHRWIQHLVDHKVGKYTPRAALGCMNHYSDLLEFSFQGESTLTRRLIARYMKGSA